MKKIYKRLMYFFADSAASLYANSLFYNRYNYKINQARMSRLDSVLRHCGSNLRVQWPITITDEFQVSIGDDVSLAAYVHIWGGGGVSIGNRVMIGTHTSISSLTHDYNSKEMFRTRIEKNVLISDDVWIGSNCTILPGIRIGKGAVIGAGSVVTRDVDPGCIVAGVPARVINNRKFC